MPPYLNTAGGTHTLARVTARFTGVLMPGWDECGCEAEPVFERPFASGLVTYTASGETVAKPFVIELVK